MTATSGGQPRADATRSRTSPAVHVTHIGGPTVLIEVGGWRLLTGPTFDPPGMRYAFGWGARSRKVVGPAVRAADLSPTHRCGAAES